MSRMRALFFGLLTSIMASPMSEKNKQVKAKDLNKQSGGLLFSNPYGPKPKNQRQIRKRLRQNPNLRK